MKNIFKKIIEYFLTLTMADRRMTVLARLTLTDLRSALLVGLPSITDILGKLDSRPHSLQEYIVSIVYHLEHFEHIFPTFS